MIVFDSLDDPKVLSLLQRGAVGVIPTDTVYGLATRASDQSGVRRLYALKGRTVGKPGTVIAASIEQLADLGIDKEVLSQVRHFWPNPLSIVIKTAPNLDYLDQGLPDVAVRIPNDSSIRRLLEQSGPLLTSSANAPGESPAVNFTQTQEYFGDKVDFYVDGGDLSGHVPSTVAIIRDGKLMVVRPGAVTINSKGEIEA